MTRPDEKLRAARHRVLRAVNEENDRLFLCSCDSMTVTELERLHADGVIMCQMLVTEITNRKALAVRKGAEE